VFAVPVAVSGSVSVGWRWQAGVQSWVAVVAAVDVMDRTTFEAWDGQISVENRGKHRDNDSQDVRGP